MNILDLVRLPSGLFWRCDEGVRICEGYCVVFICS